MRRQLESALAVLLMVSNVAMGWKMLSVLMQSPQPLHVVMSASMEPAFQRGDIILISNRQTTIEVGQIPVIWFEGAPLPMTHRAIEVIWDKSEESGLNEQLVLTKGDNNPLDDVALYPPGRRYVRRHEIIGVVKGYVPRLGWITLWLNEMQYAKYGLIGILMLLAITL